MFLIFFCGFFKINTLRRHSLKISRGYIYTSQHEQNRTKIVVSQTFISVDVECRRMTRLRTRVNINRVIFKKRTTNHTAAISARGLCAFVYALVMPPDASQARTITFFSRSRQRSTKLYAHTRADTLELELNHMTARNGRPIVAHAHRSI